MRQLAARTLSVSGWLAGGWLALVVAAGLLAPCLPLPFAPAVPDLLRIGAAPDWTGPGPRHWLGTDPERGDVLAGMRY